MFILLDTETTGAGEKDRLCQLAYKTEKGEIVNQLFKPPLPIAIEAKCVQHITKEIKNMRDGIFNSIKYWKDVVLIKGLNEMVIIFIGVISVMTFALQNLLF